MYKYQKDVLSEGENKFNTHKIQLDLILSSVDRVVGLYVCRLFLESEDQSEGLDT